MKITDDLTKKLAKTVAEIIQSSENPSATRSKDEEEFLKLHLDNVTTVDLSPDEKPFQDPPKQKEAKAKTVKEGKEEDMEEGSCSDDDMEEGSCMSDKEIEEAISKNAPASEWIRDFVHSKDPKFKGKSNDERIKMALGAYYSQKEQMDDRRLTKKGITESTKLLTEAPVKADQWIDELANVLARSTGTNDLAMAFEAWANSLYKTPVWQSIMRSPVLGELVNRMAEALDVYIGYSAEESEKEPLEEMQFPRSFRDMSDKDLMTIASDKTPGSSQARNMAKRVLDTRAKTSNTVKVTGSDEGVEKALYLNRRKKGHGFGFSEKSEDEAAEKIEEGKGGKYALSVDGKLWAKSGKRVEFSNADSAKNAKKKASEKMKDKKIEVVHIKEAADDTTEVEKEWKAAKDKKAVIAKYSLSSGISSLRPGEIKLGIRNQLNGNRSFAALDNDGKLVVISGTQSAPKVRYVTEAKEEIPSNQKEFIEWFDDKYNSLASMWLPKVDIPLLMKHVYNKKNIVCRTFDIEKPQDKEKIKMEVKSMKDKGYRIFDSSDNDDAIEYIFYK